MNRKELVEAISKKRSFLCVGLDTDIKKLPKCVTENAASDFEAIMTFNKAIIDATAPYCVAYKPNTAFYESLGTEGWRALEETVKYIRENHPDIFVIADAKRGDIGNTSAMYARTFFDHMDVDALTVAPYMGSDSVTPFLGKDGKWVILLALTSNPGSKDFQLTEDRDGGRLFEKVIETAKTWASDEEMMFVVGATRGAMFEDIRRVAPSHFLLVPGVGAQGGSLEEVVRYGMTADCGLLVNSSRGIIYVSSETDYAEAAGNAAKELSAQMAGLLSEFSEL